MRNFINIMEAFAGLTKRPSLSEAFWKWFGQSKVVDGQGQPLVVYHGTGAEIEAFKGMVWGSVTPALASEYADFRQKSPNIIPLYMKIENPFDADTDIPSPTTIGNFFNAVVDQATKTGFQLNEDNRITIKNLLNIIRTASKREESGPHFSRHNFWNDVDSSFGRDGAAAIVNFFKLVGFDGIRMIEGNEISFGAFRPDQVKSIYNKGLYNPQDSRISEHLSE